MEVEMKTDDSPAWAPAVGAAVLVAVLAVLALVAAGGWTWFAKFLDSAAPAWVQAVGSIAAIVAAIKISSRQHEQTVEREERRDALTRTQSIATPVAVAQRALTKLHDCRSHVLRAFGANGDWGSSEAMIAEASQLVEYFAALPLHTLPGYNEVETAYELLDNLREAASHLRTISTFRDRTLSVSRDLVLDFDLVMSRADIGHQALSDEWVASLKKAHGVA
jgi:hypothetical protein